MNEGCFKKYIGLKTKVLTPFIKHGTNASFPDALLINIRDN